MKTLRELLLQKHRGAEGRLDELRQGLVGQIRERGSVPEREESVFQRGVRIVWEELIRPCRRAWLGLGAAWVVIFALNGSMEEPRQASQTAMAEHPPEIREMLDEQRALMAELMGENGNEDGAVGEGQVPRQRSERSKLVHAA